LYFYFYFYFYFAFLLFFSFSNTYSLYISEGAHPRRRALLFSPPLTPALCTSVKAIIQGSVGTTLQLSITRLAHEEVCVRVCVCVCVCVCVWRVGAMLMLVHMQKWCYVTCICKDTRVSACSLVSQVLARWPLSGRAHGKTSSRTQASTPSSARRRQPRAEPSGRASGGHWG